MTPFDNTHPFHDADLARTLLVLDNYEWIKQQAADIGVSVIPLKGIDLLQTIYSERLDRPVRDIDIFCRCEKDCLRLVERLCQKEYHLAFPFSLYPKVLATKRKVVLLSCNPNKVNIDIHMAFVTKNFFSRTIGSFNEDALHRCTDNCMEATDRWLFLAQHAAFHAFSDGKWIRDLYLLFNTFESEQQAALREKARTYGFRRVMLATINRIFMHEESLQKEQFSAFDLSRSERRVLRFFNSFHRPFGRSPIDRLITSYWEFVFIDRRIDRFRMWQQLMFPSSGILTNMYRIRWPITFWFYYPLNFLISGFTSVFFLIIYLLRS